MIEAVLPHGCEGRSLHRVPSGRERVGVETQHPQGYLHWQRVPFSDFYKGGSGTRGSLTL